MVHVTRNGWLLGVLAAIVIGAITLVLEDAAQTQLLQGLLWLTIGIYLGMALMHHEAQVGVQLAFGILIAGLLVSSIAWPVLLVIAWLVHPVWDILHHVGIIKTRIHPLTVPFCIVFDILIAALSWGVIGGFV